MLDKAADWVGRKVRISQGLVDDIDKEGVILAIDEDRFGQISAWIRIQPSRWSPHHLSVPLWWVEDVETGQQAPAGSGEMKISDDKPDFCKRENWGKFENCTGEHSGIHVRKFSDGDRPLLGQSGSWVE